MKRVLRILLFGLVAGITVSGAKAGMPMGADPQAPNPAVILVVEQSPAAELAHWTSIKDSADAEEFAKYLTLFPNGMFADPALERYEELKGEKFAVSPAIDATDIEPVQGTDENKVVLPKPIVKKQKAVSKKIIKKRIAVKPAKKSPRFVTTVKIKKRKATLAVLKAPARKKSVTQVKLVSTKAECKVVSSISKSCSPANKVASQKLLVKERAGDQNSGNQSQGSSGAAGGGPQGW